ncbi:PREDICTED: aspartyl/asparaginyl beta-hydroxylase-like, partial [Apaloderma vittatum]|uniref:aspartyl/asparaginyl beta-hydroxylase-like n=1 Tax=Apaloderma vittatum TaxID=57397 RepID=UPI000521A673
MGCFSWINHSSISTLVLALLLKMRCSVEHLVSLRSVAVCYVKVTFYTAGQIRKICVMFVERHGYVCNLFSFCNKPGEEPGGVAKKKTKVKGISNGLFLVELDADDDVRIACALQIQIAVKETIKEPLKKLREKQESKKEEIKDEEEKKKARKGKDATNRKDKKTVDMNKSKKDSDKAKRDRGREKGLDKNVKSKETTKKSDSEKDGLKERSVPAQPTSESEETIQSAEKSYVESEQKNADVDLDEEVQSVLHDTLHSQPGETHEDVDESITDQWQVKEEIHGETVEGPTTDDLLRELENEMLEAYETPDSVQEDADLLADDLGAVEPEPYEAPVSYEYDTDVEKTVSDPEVPDDSELVLEDAVEHYTENRVHGDNEDHEPEHEEQTETQDTAVEDLPEEVNEPAKTDDVIEDVDTDQELPVESKHTEDVVATEPEDSVYWEEILEAYWHKAGHNNKLGKSEKETEQDKPEKAKKKKPKLLNKFDKTIKAELDAAEKLRKKGKVEEALRAFESLVNQYPQSPRARYGKAQSEDDLAEKMRSNEMLQKAINTYDEVVSLPNVPSDLIKLSLKREADRQQFLGRMRGSLVTLQKLVQLFPSDTSFKNDLGVGYLLIGDNSNAKKVYEEVLSLAPNDGFAKVHYGFILKAENKIAESIPYLKEGLESGDPGTDDGRFYFHLGDALQRMGDEEAYKWYELGYQRGHFASVWQRSLYNVKGLKAQPWWTAKETGYTELVK